LILAPVDEATFLEMTKKAKEDFNHIQKEIDEEEAEEEKNSKRSFSRRTIQKIEH